MWEWNLCNPTHLWKHTRNMLRKNGWDRGLDMFFFLWDHRDLPVNIFGGWHKNAFDAPIWSVKFMGCSNSFYGFFLMVSMGLFQWFLWVVLWRVFCRHLRQERQYSEDTEHHRFNGPDPWLGDGSKKWDADNEPYNGYNIIYWYGYIRYGSNCMIWI